MSTPASEARPEPATTGGRPATLGRWALVAVALAGFGAHAALFNFVTDDAYISFRYARNLAEHGQLVFNLGERVEGYTNFLWTVILAGLLKLRLQPEVTSRVLGVLLGALGLLLTLRLGRTLHEDRASPWDAVAPLLLAATGSFAAWSMGGLETQLFTVLVLAGSWLYLRDLLAWPATDAPRRWLLLSALCFGLAALTRPEGVFLFALTALHRLLYTLIAERRFRPRKVEAGWIAIFVLVVGAHFLWRWRYYGWPFPNTYYIKSSSTTVDRGLYYLWSCARDYALYLLPPLVLLGWPGRAARGLRVLLGYATLVIVPFLVYVVRVGGDFMGLYRFLVPLLPLCALLAQESLRVAARRAAPRAGRLVPTLAVAAVVLLHAAASVEVSVRQVRATGADRGIDSIGYLKKFADDRALVGKWLASVVQADDVLSVGGAGAQPYFARVPTLDAFGLTNAYIAHYVPAASDRPGHQKFACHEFVVENRPCGPARKGAPPPPPRPLPTILCHTYRLGEYAPHHPPAGDAAYWRGLGFEWVSAKIPGLEPPYYSFLKRRDRALGPFPAVAPPPAPPVAPPVAPPAAGAARQP
jgi:arabinofuranosyltransferase